MSNDFVLGGFLLQQEGVLEELKFMKPMTRDLKKDNVSAGNDSVIGKKLEFESSEAKNVQTKRKFRASRLVQYISVLAHFTLSLSLSLSLNFCPQVVAIYSTRVEEACFRMRVTLGVILIRSLVYTKHVPGRLRSGSE